MDKPMRYYLVPRDDLAGYGHEDGVTKDQMNKTLEGLDEFDEDDLVVLMGHEVELEVTTKTTRRIA